MRRRHRLIMDTQKHYQEEVAPKLMEEFHITNKMAVPKLRKIVLNIGLKEAVSDKGVLAHAEEQFAAISGQKPKITRAKKAIANFKLRQGDPVGLTVTLRGKRMDDFFLKLISLALPRSRDFHGVPKTSFDKQGNYSLGLTEQIIFPEIDYSKIDKIRGLQITFVTNARDAKISQRLLQLMGMPFEKGDSV